MFSPTAIGARPASPAAGAYAVSRGDVRAVAELTLDLEAHSGTRGPVGGYVFLQTSQIAVSHSDVADVGGSDEVVEDVEFGLPVPDLCNLPHRFLPRRHFRIIRDAVNPLRSGWNNGVPGRGRIYADDWEQASHNGDLVHAVEAGVLGRDDVARLGDVLIGKAEGRASARDITIFDSTGLAIQDLAIALAAIGRAAELDLPTLDL